MVRYLLLLALVLAMPSTLVAQDVEESPTIITGVVRDYDGVTAPYGSIEKYTQAIRLAAWRENDGPVQTVPIWITVKADTIEGVRALEKRFPRSELVRFVILGAINIRGEDGGPQTAEADWAGMLAPINDNEVTAAADAILNPVPFTDAELGVFEPHPSLPDHFGQSREFMGTPMIFEVILEPLAPGSRELALSMARLVWGDLETIDSEIRETITDHIYSRRAQQAGIVLLPLDEGQPVSADGGADELPKLTREQFQFDHALLRMSCSSLSYCTLRYFTQDASWEWSYSATIRRNDDGEWYLDGWDFP